MTDNEYVAGASSPSLTGRDVEERDYWQREALRLADALAASEASAQVLRARVEAGQRLADATEMVAEAVSRLTGGSYVLRTRDGSAALGRLFIANREWAALAAAPDVRSDAPSAASPRQGLEDDSSGCLTGTGWAKESDGG